MKPKAYIETTIVSYLTAWPARDVVIAGRQQTTRDWWHAAADRFELVASALVIYEASVGDSDAACARLTALKTVTMLDATEEAAELARLRSCSTKGRRRCWSHRHRRYERCRVSGNMELSAHRERHDAVSDRSSLSRCWLRTDRHLYPCRTHGVRR